MMSNEAEGTIPQVPFSLSELQAIEQVLWGYSEYLRKSPARDQNRYHSLQRIRKRLTDQLRAGNGEVRVFLNVEELEDLLAALLEFTRLVGRLFPKTKEREAERETVNIWRLRLAGIIAEFAGC